MYDLRVNPPSFDFLAFVILARYHGAQAIRFIPGVCKSKLGYYSATEQAERVTTICEAVCDLYGMPYTYGEPEPLLDVAWPPFWRAGKRTMHGYTFGWMRSITKPDPIMPSEAAKAWAREQLDGRKIVVHLRSGKNIPGRNSGPDWKRWADNHDAYVLPDHGEDPISLDERVALHELAELNIGAASGHMTISMFSQRPYIVMKFLSNAGISTTQNWHSEQGFFPGDQFPWSTPKQRLVWDGRDDYEAIDNQFQQWSSQAGSG